MNILLIVPSFYPATVYGGPIFSTLHACEALSVLDNIEVKVSTTNANRDSRLVVKTNQWLAFNKQFFVKYYNETIIGKFSLSLYLNIWKDIKQADVVHIQGIFSTPTPISLFFATLFKKPILLSPRGSFCGWGLNQGSRFKSLWTKLFISPFNSSIYWHATCQQEKDDIVKQFPDARVFIIPNGIDIKAYSYVNFLSKEVYLQKFTQQTITPSKILVSMGRLHKVKGFDILIKAFITVRDTYTDAVLLIAGKDVGEKQALDALIKEHNLSKNVFFVGEISDQDKIDFLANADLFVLPSRTENFGNVYIESLAAGTPIVASLNTPWQEVNATNCGKWVANTTEATSNAMLELLSQDRELMRINAKAMSNNYEWKTIALQFKNLFEEITL
jgi:glycosyltransferase involved in cell wall biosynthesis